MKKVTFFVANIFKSGGVQRVVTIISNNLSELGYDICIISLFKTDKNPFFKLNNNVKVYNLFEQPFDIRVNYLKIVKKFYKFMKTFDSDVFINAGIGYTPLTYPALRKKKVKKISWEHQNYYFGKKFGMEWIGKRIADNKLDGIIVLTKYDFNNYKVNMKKNKNVYQIYNPIDNKIDSINYNNNTRKIISCGSLSKQKGFDIMIEVSKVVFEKHPEWEWHIWGEGEERLYLESKIKEYRLEKNVILKGYSKELYEKYKEYSIYCMTSRHEGFPMVLLEAQANGLPIVSFDCISGPREIVVNKKNGYLVDCFNIQEMASKICYLIENKEICKEFSNNAVSKKEEFEINSIIKKWVEIIENE